MKVETWLFGAGALFFAPIALIYGIVTDWNEPVGTVSIALTAGLALMIAVYLYFTALRIDDRPEDDPFGDIATGAGEVGEFAPTSWWPLALAFSAALIFLGMAIGWWLMGIGLIVGFVALLGWVFEFYLGEYAH